MNNDLEHGDTGAVLGNTAKITFASFGNREAEGKVDTGATTSSLHAEDIHINQQNQTVSFKSDVLSDNVVTLDLAGTQEVHSADAGGVTRPVVNLDITVDGKPINNAAFNLNDRDHMDLKILIGQNVLKAGRFVIDPNKDESPAPVADTNALTREQAVLQAVNVLVENNVSLAELVTYMRTVAVNQIKE